MGMLDISIPLCYDTADPKLGKQTFDELMAFDNGTYSFTLAPIHHRLGFLVFLVELSISSERTKPINVKCILVIKQIKYNRNLFNTVARTIMGDNMKEI